MIIEEIINIIFNIIKNFDIYNLILSAILIILPSFYKIIKVKLTRYYPSIAGFIAYVFTIILIGNYMYNGQVFNEMNFILVFLILISVNEIYNGIRGIKFIEIYELLKEYYFYKKIDVDIVNFNYSENDIERIKFIIRSNFNILSAYSEVGDFKIKIENKKNYLYMNLEIKFNKKAKDYEVDNIINRYKELEDINYIDSVRYSPTLYKLYITIKDNNLN